jgi:acyl-ACP thioesterase
MCDEIRSVNKENHLRYLDVCVNKNVNNDKYANNVDPSRYHYGIDKSIINE